MQSDLQRSKDRQYMTISATARPHALANWLYSVAVLVFVMVVVGGITRLTESGLSITEWQPISGTLPPLTDEAWQEAFRKYQEIPEYQLLKQGMSLAEFKFIFFWEWVHRLLGRIIGLAFFLPMVWFLFRRAIPAGYLSRLFALLALGALQGVIGWWMVTSGLSVRTDVSQYRLAIHLLTALFILGGLVWTARDLRILGRKPYARPARLTGFGLIVFIGLFIQLFFGALVAGLNSGYVSNSWPLMQGRFYPDGVAWVGLATFGEDPFLTHFIHRWWAWVVVALLVVLARKVKKLGQRPQSIALHSAFGTQVILGIATVMTGVSFWLAVLHQAVGALVVASTVVCVHTLGRR